MRNKSAILSMESVKTWWVVHNWKVRIGASCDWSLVVLWDSLLSYSALDFFSDWTSTSCPQITGLLLNISVLIVKQVYGRLDCNNRSSHSQLDSFLYSYKRNRTLIQSTSIVWCATRESQQSSIIFSESMSCVHPQSLVVVSYPWNERHTLSRNDKQIRTEQSHVNCGADLYNT